MLSGLRSSATCGDVKYPANCSSRVGGNGCESSEKIYEAKPDKKFVRCVTVIAYVFSVSFGAILLSLYYIFIWNPYTHKAGMIKVSTPSSTPLYLKDSVEFNKMAFTESLLLRSLSLSNNVTSPEYEEEPSFDENNEEIQSPYTRLGSDISSENQKRRNQLFAEKENAKLE